MDIPIILSASSLIPVGQAIKDISATANLSAPSASVPELIPATDTATFTSVQPSDTYGSYQNVQRTVFSNIEKIDGYSLALANGLNSNDSGILSGLKHFSSFLENEASSYQQDIREYSSFRPSSKNVNTEAIDLTGFKDKEN